MTGTTTIQAPWSNEFIVACRYLELPETEVGCIPGVAYHLPGEKRVTTRLTLGTTYAYSVHMLGTTQPEVTFAVHHVFVERYIKYLGLRFQDVEIFRLHVAHGEFPTLPKDISGEMVSHFQETAERHSWFTFEHISGPYQADAKLLVSQFTAGRLSEVEAKCPVNLIPERQAYLLNPQDLPLMGVIPAGSQAESDRKMFEDLILRDRKSKQVIQ